MMNVNEITREYLLKNSEFELPHTKEEAVKIKRLLEGSSASQFIIDDMNRIIAGKKKYTVYRLIIWESGYIEVEDRMKFFERMEDAHKYADELNEKNTWNCVYVATDLVW